MSASRGRILIVDDDPDVREVLMDRLAAEGFEAATASDGAEGLRRIREGDLDLVLLDLQMPEMDGMGVLCQIQEERLDATVVIMTAYGSVERAVEAMKAGAFDFILKPLNAERLRVVVGRPRSGSNYAGRTPTSGRWWPGLSPHSSATPRRCRRC